MCLVLRVLQPSSLEQPVLNTPEVHTLFSHPLASFLSNAFPANSTPSPSSSADTEARAETAAIELEYHTYTDSPWPWPTRTFIRTLPSSETDAPAQGRSAGDQIPVRSTRIHRFLTGREAGGIKPIFGLTAYADSRIHSATRQTQAFFYRAIMIATATVAYGCTPDFEVESPDEPALGMRVAWALRHPNQRLRAALEEEKKNGEREARSWERWKGRIRDGKEWVQRQRRARFKL